MFRILLFFTVTTLSCLAENVQDLGDGLGYVRYRDLDHETLALTQSSALVIDLRGAAGSQAESIARLRAVLDVSVRGQIRLVLIEPTTSPAVLAALEHRGRSVLTLAAAAPGQKADITVATSLEADRQAREAVDGGKPLTSVLAANVDKRRYDEAAMVRDHNNGVPIPDSPPDALDANASKSGPPKASSIPKDAPSKPAPPPFDAVLQRAIHIFQALQALKKI